MKPHSVFLALCLASFAVPAMGDTFVLKDGTKLEGRIISEEGGEYLLEIQVTRTIKDQRRVPKADVAEIIAEKLDETAFLALPELVPTPDLLAAEEYQRRIELVETFIKSYPKSPRAADAEKILATLKSEAAVVEGGGVKLDGKLIPAEEYRSNAYDLDAAVLAGKVRGHVAKGELLASLRAFDSLSTEYATSAAFTEVTPLVLQVMEKHQEQVAHALKEFDAKQKEQKTGLERMSPSARNVAESALAEEAALIESRFQEEKKTRQKWVTPHLMHKASLQESLRTVQQEIRRLNNIRPAANPVNPGQLYRDAWAKIHDAEAEPNVANAAISAVRNARVPARYVTMLEDAAKVQAETKAASETSDAPQAPENP